MVKEGGGRKRGELTGNLDVHAAVVVAFLGVAARDDHVGLRTEVLDGLDGTLALALLAACILVGDGVGGSGHGDDAEELHGEK